MSRIPERLHAQLSPMLDRIEIHSPSTFTVSDEPAPPPGPLVPGLQALLYRRCHAGLPASSENSLSSASRTTSPRQTPQATGFLQALAQANRGHKRWDAGWCIEGVDARGWLMVHKGDCRRTLPPEFAASSTGRPIQLGEEVHLPAMQAAMHWQSGFYIVHGETLGDELEEALAVRLYMHVPATHAAELLATVTGVLNPAQVPFRFKCLGHPDLYGRTDAAVLYVSRRHLHITVRLLHRHVSHDLRRALVPRVPFCSQELSREHLPGIGLAEEPGTGESFGMHRCRLVAEGLVDAWHQGRQDLESRWHAIDRRFRDVGLSLRKPHLNAGSADLPEPDFDTPSTWTPVSTPSPAEASTSGHRYLQTADHLGRRLCRDAIWHDGRCGWLGWLPGPDSSSPIYRGVGPSLAHGTAGIALFLAELWRRMGQPELRATAEGAIRGALPRLDASDDRGRDLGQAKGIAWTLQRLGHLLDQGAWIERGRRFLASCPPAVTSSAVKAGRMPWVGAAERSLNDHLRGDRPWPCGVEGGGETPGLQLGLAGIGYTFLRRLDPNAVPAVPLLTRTEPNERIDEHI